MSSIFPLGLIDGENVSKSIYGSRQWRWHENFRIESSNESIVPVQYVRLVGSGKNSSRQIKRKNFFTITLIEYTIIGIEIACDLLFEYGSWVTVNDQEKKLQSSEWFTLTLSGKKKNRCHIESCSSIKMG